MSRHPEVKWAERLDKVYITVLLPDAKDVKVNLEPDGIFTFSATAGSENNFYELKIDLHDKVNAEESKINTGVRNIFCVVDKAEKGWWKKLLRGDDKTPHYVKVDWDKWVDEDDDDPKDVDLGNMNFSNLGGMGGMGGGMGGMDFSNLGGMGGMGDGMGGMDFSNLGSMRGMGDGMDDDLADSDDEEQEAAKTDDVKKTEVVGKTEEVASEEKV